MVTHRLDEVCEVLMGQAPSGEAYNTDGRGWPLIAGAGDFGESKPEAKKFTTEAPKLSQNGDIVLGIRASIGEKVRADGVYCLGRGVAALRAGTSLESRFLWHWLTHAAPRLAAKAKGATFKQVSREDISELEIELPPLSVQRRIADVLDTAKALEAKRRAGLAQLDSLTQSLFLDLFGDPLSNPKGWELRTIGDEVKLQGGYAFKSSDYTNTGIRLVKISNVHKENLDWSDIDYLPSGHLEEFSDFSLWPGDVVLALTRPIIKSLNSVKIAIVQPTDVPCLLNQRVGRFRFSVASRLTPAYLLEYCRTKTFFHAVQSFCSESLQPNMSTSQVESIKIAVPPMELQREFAHRVTVVDKLRAAQRASLAELDALFASLQHRAFRGEL